MKKIISIAGLLCAFVAASFSPAMADQRTSAIFTAPVPILTATTTNSGLGLSYAVIKKGFFEIAPFVSMQNLTNIKGHHINVLPGLEANVSIWRVTLGIGAVLRPGGKVNFDHHNYTPTVILGFKL